MFLAIFILGCEALSRDQIRELDEYMKNVRRCRKFAALTLGVVHEGKTVLTQSYGKADWEENIPATADTPFAIGSLSKAFTSLLLAMLLREKQDNGME